MEFCNNAELSRYELREGDAVVAVADYIERPDAIEIPHTEVDPRLRGRGIGAELVKQTLDAVRELGKPVIPTCSFVAAFISSNPSYADLVAA
jgi:predicted GNAT family acetyltransferase